MKTKAELKSRKNKIRNADRMASLWIRQKYADQNGMVTCYTCGFKMPWRDSQCGHFMSRRNMSTRWYEANMRVQCPSCNMMQGGMWKTYRKNLNKEMGDGEADRIRALARTPRKWEEHELTEIENHYIEKIKSKNFKLK